MKKLVTYIKGGLIGMIAQYCFRIEFGYLQGFILNALVIRMIVDVAEFWRE